MSDREELIRKLREVVAYYANKGPFGHRAGSFLHRHGQELLDELSASPALPHSGDTGLLRECYEWLFESKTDGPRVSEGAIERGFYTPEFADLHRRLLAAVGEGE